jgi:predicted nuclease with TOPRIM domain
VWSSDGRDELFDLSVDPHELRNVADQRPVDVRRLRTRLLETIAAIEVTESDGAPDLSEETAEQIKAMGYLQ